MSVNQWPCGWREAAMALVAAVTFVNIALVG